MLTTIFWILVVPAALAGLISNRTGRRFLEYVEWRLREPSEGHTPAASLIVPVKGIDHELHRNLRSLVDQDYPDFELIIVTRSASDEAVRVAQSLLGGTIRIVIAGEPPAGTGEKVHNLLVAVSEARPESEVFVFADSDGQVESDWLRVLIAPLKDESLGATTGFRWYFPEEGHFWPLMRSVWDSTIAGNLRDDDKNFAWGGGTAIRKKTFEDANVAKFWQGTISDDYRLTAALNAAGLGIRFEPGAMVATTGVCGRGEFLDWAVRQLIITRVYRPGLWLAGFAAHILYCGAIVVSLLLAASGSFLGLGGLVVSILPGMGRGLARGAAALVMFPQRAEWLDRFGWAYFWYTPIATWIWLYVFARSALTRTIKWRGNVYKLVSAEKTQCLSLAAATTVAVPWISS
ncbi:MAG TPA: glycosyltransferase family 2 protein [Bryobacterales bacterium]|nr:glycosyltransferase family 2 protein [Bryobacterales bacterium]